MRIQNLTQNTILAFNARLADTFLSRLTGLPNRTSLSEGEALVITRSNSIHMLFMRFPIDVVFVDRKNIVAGCVKRILPFRLSPIFWKADRAIELPAGTIDKTRTVIGDSIEFVL